MMQLNNWKSGERERALNDNFSDLRNFRSAQTFWKEIINLNESKDVYTLKLEFWITKKKLFKGYTIINFVIFQF